MGPLCLWQCLYPLISCNQICILFQLQNVICRDCKIPTILPWPSASATCMVLSTNYQGLLYIGIINSIELVSSSARVTTCICWKFSHQVAPLALVRNLATRWRHMHCHIAWDFLIGSSVSINCVFSSIKVISARCSTLVINWGHQQGYSTRVIN